MDAKELASKIEEEFEKHDKNKQEEKERHKTRVSNLKGKAGLGEMIERASELRELNQKRESLEDDIEDQFYTVLNALCPRQRQSADSLTIRDGKVWHYGRSSQIGLGRFLAKAKYRRQAKQLIEEDNEELFETLMDKIEELEVDSSSSYRVKFVTPEVVEQLPSDVLNGKYMRVSASSPKSVYYGSKKKQLSGYGADKIKVTSDKPSNLATLVSLKPHVIDAYDDLEEELNEQIDKREDVINTMKSKASKQLVASAI